MIDEYNLYDLKDKFIGTYDVFKIADILGVEPENVLSIYEAGGKYKKYRIAKILRPYEMKKKLDKKRMDFIEEWNEVTALFRERIKRR